MNHPSAIARHRGKRAFFKHLGGFERLSRLILAIFAFGAVPIGHTETQPADRSLDLLRLQQAQMERLAGHPAVARDLLKTVQPENRSWEWAFLASLVGPSPRLIDQSAPLPSAWQEDVAEWSRIRLQETPSGGGQLDSGPFGYLSYQRGRWTSRWIAEDCGACEQYGLIERTDPTTTLGGFQGVNRAEVSHVMPTLDGSAALVHMRQLPDRAGRTLDGDKLAGSGDFFMPLRNRVKLVHDVAAVLNFKGKIALYSMHWRSCIVYGLIYNRLNI